MILGLRGRSCDGSATVVRSCQRFQRSSDLAFLPGEFEAVAEGAFEVDVVTETLLDAEVTGVAEPVSFRLDCVVDESSRTVDEGRLDADELRAVLSVSSSCRRFNCNCGAAATL